MDITLIGKIVNVLDNTIIGYQVSAGSVYTVAVTKGKAKEIGVVDIDLAEYFDLNEIIAVPTGKTTYGVVDQSSFYMEDYRDIPRDVLGDKKLYYGYCFDDRYIVTLDSDIAIKRMIDSANGTYIE